MKSSFGTLKKASLLIPLLVAFWLLTDDEATGKRHHPAVVTALRRHPPSLRVFRFLILADLVIWGAAFALYVWYRTVGPEIVGHLLFRPPPTDAVEEQLLAMNQPATADLEEDEEEGGEDDDLEKPLVEKEADNDEDPQEKEAEASDDDDDDTVLPPSAVTVANIALDLLLVTLVSLFFFTISSAEGGRYVDGMTTFQTIAMVAAPIFPLVLFVGVTLQSFLPWSQRNDFWTVVSFTLCAPFCDVTFRDGFIGDILTSSVRPMQDVAFTVFYFFSGLRGWWSQAYDWDDAALPLETSWLLHTVVLPMCMVSPLWWRFLQNLRQCYDAKKRWPYLGNALKYFVAAEVAMFGVFDPTRKQTVLWVFCFVMATLYQVWWDVFMDWELFKIQGGKISLREPRVYSYTWMYWAIFLINFALRFCWTLSFLPPSYLNHAGVLSETFNHDFSSFINPAIASAELVRRTLWGLLRLELEAIKVSREDPKRFNIQWASPPPPPPENELDELKSMPASSMDTPHSLSSTGSGLPLLVSSDMSSLSDVQILGELTLYATAFTSLGILAAAHRATF